MRFCNLSKVRERIQKIEETCIIKGYQLNLNFSELGYRLGVMIMSKLIMERLNAFIENLIEFPEINEFYGIT